MAKTFKILGIVVLTVLVLFGISIYLLVHYIDPNKLKAQLSTTIYNNTGHHLTINGDLSWSFFPWVGFKITNTELDNIPGFNHTPLAKIGEADISIQLLPLLSGHIEVNNVTLSGLQINLIRNASNKTNWKINNNISVNKQNKNDNDKIPTLNFSIANLTVVNSSVNFDNQINNQSYHLSNLYINGKNVGTQQLFPLTVSFDLMAHQFTKPMAVSFNGNLNIDNQINSIAINQLNANINNIELQANISAQNLQSEAIFQGDINIPAFKLPKFLNLFNINLPRMRKADALQKISANLAFNGTNNTLSIKPLRIGVDNTMIHGNIDLKNRQTHRVTFKLTTNSLNLDNYLPKKITAGNQNLLPGDTNQTTNAQQTQKIDLPTTLLRSLNLQGSIAINQLIVNNLHMSNVQLNLGANNGFVQFTPLTANLYEGKLTGNATLNVRSDIPQYQFSTQLKNVQAQSLFNDLINKNFISGTAALSTNLTTAGNSLTALVNHLNGSGQFIFNNGALNNINIDYQLARVKALLDKKAAPAQPKDNTTPFGKITGTVLLRNGVATNNDLHIDNKDFTATGAGTINLTIQKMNYLIAILPNAGSLKNYRIPIKITGPLKSPNILLATGDILQQVLNKQKERLIKHSKQQATKQIQQQINQLANRHDVQKTLGNLVG